MSPPSNNEGGRGGLSVQWHPNADFHHMQHNNKNHNNQHTATKFSKTKTVLMVGCRQKFVICIIQFLDQLSLGLNISQYAIQKYRRKIKEKTDTN